MSTRRYRVHEPVGHGSFGTVYRATVVADAGFSKVVALKVLKADAKHQVEMTSRLRDEARLLGLLRHRAIVQVDGLVRVQGRWAVVMEFVDGANLRDLAGRTPLPPGAALEVIAEICSALHMAYHQDGPEGRPLRLIHRDIKPSNVHLTHSGDVKVLDFGIARAEFGQREAETSSMLMGSFGYMSPERLDGIDGPEGDIYGLGVLLFEIVVGKRLGRTSANEQRHELHRRDAQQRFRMAAGPQAEEVAHLLGDVLAFAPTDRPAAKALELRCRALARRVGGLSLAEWSAHHVGALRPIASSMVEDASSMTGITLEESDSGRTLYIADAAALEDNDPTAVAPLDSLVNRSPSAPPHRAARSSSDTDRDLRLVVVALLVVMALVGAGLWLAQSDVVSGTADVIDAVQPSVEPAPAAASTPRVPLPVEPKPAEPKPVEPKPVEPKPEEPKPVEPRAQPSAPTPEAAQTAPERPQVAPAPAPSPARVEVTGDADSVTLVSPKGRHSAGALPPGSYRIEAGFSGNAPGVAGQVTLEEGQRVTVNCKAAFRLCSVR